MHGRTMQTNHSSPSVKSRLLPTPPDSSRKPAKLATSERETHDSKRERTAKPASSSASSTSQSQESPFVELGNLIERSSECGQSLSARHGRSQSKDDPSKRHDAGEPSKHSALATQSSATSSSTPAGQEPRVSRPTACTTAQQQQGLQRQLSTQVSPTSMSMNSHSLVIRSRKPSRFSFTLDKDSVTAQLYKAIPEQAASSFVIILYAPQK